MLERRRLTRTRVQVAAQMIFDDQFAVKCTVRDLTTLGAGIEIVDDLAHCPFNFVLRFDGARSLRPCRLVWQKSKRIGVEFVERARRKKS